MVSAAEGEVAMDLVAYAKALADAGVVLYGGVRSAETVAQLEVFGDGARYLNFVEAANPDQTFNETATTLGITTLPTWIFADDSRAEDVQSIMDLALASGVFVPAGETPSFFPIGDQSVALNSPLHVPIDGYDPNSESLFISVTSSDPNLLEATALTGNQSYRLEVAEFGTMTFELFQQRAPTSAARIIELTNDGFYDDLTFHRIIDGFMSQFGDPNGNGTGGSGLGDFDDEFHLDLQHNRSGVLSYANSGDDTNNSQLFMTDAPQRHLDFQHNIVGQLTEGERARDFLNRDVGTAPIITSATIIDDTENGIVLLRPTGNGTGVASVTVTVRDADGLTFSETFNVAVFNDTSLGSNRLPFLNPVNDFVVPAGDSISMALTASDLEGDNVAYSAFRLDATPYDAAINAATGEIDITPAPGFLGSFDVLVGATPANQTATANNTDTQRVTVSVTGSNELKLNLDATSDTGTSDSDNVTSDETMSFTVTGTEVGATIDLVLESTTLASVVATDSIVTFPDVDLSAQTDGVLNLLIRQTLDGNVTSLAETFQVTLDRASPATANLVPSSAFAGRPFSIDIDHPEEDSGLTYALISGPGLSIDAQSGRISWTPDSGQIGQQQATLRYTDAAGNTFDEVLTINVAESPTAFFDFEITDLDGAEISEIFAGQDFLLNVSVVDNRLFAGRHVFAAYLDIIFDSSLASASGENPINFGPNFTFVQSGAFMGDVIDEIGAVSNLFNEAVQDLFTIRMTADATGDLSFVGEAPDGIGHEFLLVESPSPVPNSEIDFGTASLRILRAPQPITLQPVSSIIADPDSDTVTSLLGTTSVDGLLDAWADFNFDGDFDDPGEQIIDDFAINNESRLIPFTVPAGTVSRPLTIAYGITPAGDVSLEATDQLSNLLVLDGAIDNDVTVAINGSVTNVSTTVNNELLVLVDGATVFTASGLSSVSLQHDGGDSNTTLGNLSAVLPSPANLSVEANGGNDVLVLQGFADEINLEGSAHGYRELEEIQINDSSVIHLDEAGVVALGSTANTLSLSLSELESTEYAGAWTVESTESTLDGFIRILESGLARVRLHGGSPWTNPIEALDVTNNGQLEPIDALNILNELNRRTFLLADGNTLVDPTTVASFPNRYFDTNADGNLTPIDALRVVNRLGTIQLEGEQAAAAATTGYLSVDEFWWEEDEEQDRALYSDVDIDILRDRS